MLVVDVRRQVDRIKEIIRQIDIAPRQVLIDAKILEVNTDSLEDLGIDFNAEFTAGRSRGTNSAVFDLNTDASDTGINSNIFTTTFPGNTDQGIHAVFRRLSGEDMSWVVHALSQDQRTKTLSSPQILTIENQEAAILVGEQFPIFEANVTDQGTTTETLSFYQPIGIILQVVVQVTPDNEISMIIHPTVSTVGTFVTGTSGLQQPRINIREADTRVIIRDGETLVIGGLLEDIEDEQYFRVPVLGYLPLIDKLFTRRQTDLQQRNLLIFITPHIVAPEEEKLSRFQEGQYESIGGSEEHAFLIQRKKKAGRIFKQAKKSYQEAKYDLARHQFLRVLSLNNGHTGAMKYLQKIDKIQLQYASGAGSPS